MKSRTTLTLQDCGNFGAIKALEAGIKSLHVATIYGLAVALAERKTPDKLSVFNALQGNFRVVKSDGEALESGLLIFPPDFFKMLSAPLKLLAETPQAELRFAYDLVSNRSTSEAGFAMNFVPRLAPVVGNPMDDFVSAVPKKKK